MAIRNLIFLRNFKAEGFWGEAPDKGGVAHGCKNLCIGRRCEAYISGMCLKGLRSSFFVVGFWEGGSQSLARCIASTRIPRTPAITWTICCVRSSRHFGLGHFVRPGIYAGCILRTACGRDRPSGRQSRQSSHHRCVGGSRTKTC